MSPESSTSAGERIVVGFSGHAGRRLIRRAARMLSAGGELHVVHIRTTAERAVPSSKELDRLRAVTVDAGGIFHAVGGEELPTALLQFARSLKAGQIVLGTSRPSGELPVSGPGPDGGRRPTKRGHLRRAPHRAGSVPRRRTGAGPAGLAWRLPRSSSPWRCRRSCSSAWSGCRTTSCPPTCWSS